MPDLRLCHPACLLGLAAILKNPIKGKTWEAEITASVKSKGFSSSFGFFFFFFPLIRELADLCRVLEHQVILPSNARGAGPFPDCGWWW